MFEDQVRIPMTSSQSQPPPTSNTLNLFDQDTLLATFSAPPSPMFKPDNTNPENSRISEENEDTRSTEYATSIALRGVSHQDADDEQLTQLQRPTSSTAITTLETMEVRPVGAPQFQTAALGEATLDILKQHLIELSGANEELIVEAQMWRNAYITSIQQQPAQIANATTPTEGNTTTTASASPLSVDWETKLRTAEADKEALQHSVSQLSEAAGLWQRQCNALRVELDTVRSEAQQELLACDERSRAQIDAHVHDSALREAALKAKYCTELAKQRRDFDELRNEFERRTAENDKRHHQRSEHLTAQVTELTSENADLRRDILRMANEYAEREDALEKQIEETRLNQSSKQELEASHQAANVLRQSNAELRESITQLQNALASKEAIFTCTRNSFQQLIRNLESQLVEDAKSHEAERRLWQCKVAELEHQLTQYTSAVGAAHKGEGEDNVPSPQHQNHDAINFSTTSTMAADCSDSVCLEHRAPDGLLLLEEDGEESTSHGNSLIDVTARGTIFPSNETPAHVAEDSLPTRMRVPSPGSLDSSLAQADWVLKAVHSMLQTAKKPEKNVVGPTSEFPSLKEDLPVREDAPSAPVPVAISASPAGSSSSSNLPTPAYSSSSSPASIHNEAPEPVKGNLESHNSRNDLARSPSPLIQPSSTPLAANPIPATAEITTSNIGSIPPTENIMSSDPLHASSSSALSEQRSTAQMQKPPLYPQPLPPQQPQQSQIESQPQPQNAPPFSAPKDPLPLSPVSFSKQLQMTKLVAQQWAAEYLRTGGLGAVFAAAAQANSAPATVTKSSMPTTLSAFLNGLGQTSQSTVSAPGPVQPEALRRPSPRASSRKAAKPAASSSPVTAVSTPIASSTPKKNKKSSKTKTKHQQPHPKRSESPTARCPSGNTENSISFSNVMNGWGGAVSGGGGPFAPLNINTLHAAASSGPVSSQPPPKHPEAQANESAENGSGSSPLLQPSQCHPQMPAYLIAPTGSPSFVWPPTGYSGCHTVPTFPHQQPQPQQHCCCCQNGLPTHLIAGAPNSHNENGPMWTQLPHHHCHSHHHHQHHLSHPSSLDTSMASRRSSSCCSKNAPASHKGPASSKSRLLKRML